MTDILLITEQSIKNITNISDNMAGKLLLTAIRESQEINLREILGDALLDEIKRQIQENDVRETYNQLILQCQYYLAYQSCANICMITSVKIDNAGLQRVSDEKMEPLPVSEVNQIHDYYQQKADFYCERLQNFLLQHKEDYPQLTTRQCNSINANLYSSASCGIFLGGPRSKGTQRGGDGMNSSKSQGVEVLDVELTENGTYDYTPKGYGYNKAHIVVNTPEIKNQEKTITITENGVSVVVPDPEYTGMEKIDITVDVPEKGLKYMNSKPYADETGLAALGWDEESINYFKYNNYLYPWEFDKSKMTIEEIQTNLASCASYSTWETYKNQVTFLPKDRTYTPTYFSDCDKLKSVPLIDLSGRTYVSGLFYNNPELINVPLFDTSNITSFGSEQSFSNAGMICSCPKIKSIPLFDTSKGKIFGSMLRGCTGLETIPLFDTGEGTNFNNMLNGCSNLKAIPQLNLSNGLIFNNMFQYCSSLISVPILNTHNGTEFQAMFYYCYALNRIESIDVSNSTNLKYFVDYCHKLENINFNGSINISVSFTATRVLTYDSIKSILTACSKTTNANEKTVDFNRTIADQNQELTNLVAQCTEKGWTVSGLTIQ